MTSPTLLAPPIHLTPVIPTMLQNSPPTPAPPVHPAHPVPSMLQHASGICISARLQTALLPAPLSGPL